MALTQRYLSRHAISKVESLATCYQFLLDKFLWMTVFCSYVFKEQLFQMTYSRQLRCKEEPSSFYGIFFISKNHFPFLLMIFLISVFSLSTKVIDFCSFTVIKHYDKMHLREGNIYFSFSFQMYMSSSWQKSMEVGYRHNIRNRKLRDNISVAKRKQKERTGSDLKLLAAQGSSPNSTTSWEPSVLILKPMGVISYFSFNSKQCETC